MNARAATTENLIDVLERVLDKSIVIEAWVWLNLASSIEVAGNFVLSAAEVYEGYGELTQKRELFPHLFPYWRKDLWTK